MNKDPVTTYFKAEAISDTELRCAAPSIFATGAMIGLSSRYKFVPTVDIVNGLREKNWVPVAVEEQRVRISERQGFQKHLVRFRRTEQMHTLDEWNAELVLINSHDAGCAYILQIGIYRRLCSNGLVVSGENYEAIRFRHAGLQAIDVVHASFRILDYVPRITLSIDRFRNHKLTESEMATFAKKALSLRYDEPEQSPIEPATLLTVRRLEDQSTDLWTVYNRIQENLERGGLSDNRRDRRGHLRTMRSLRGIDSRVSLNQALWNLAEATANIAN